MMLGQFDEFGGAMRDDTGRESWQGGRDALAAFRTADERNLGSVVVEPGAGHFAWSERSATYLMLFIRKAARARLPSNTDDELLLQVKREVAAPLSPPLREINPASGWLAELPDRNAPRNGADSYEKFSGPRANAGWHFDREMAEATVAYHAELSGRRDQFIRWNDPVWVDAGARFFFTKLQWVGDGRTFEVHRCRGVERLARSEPAHAPRRFPRSGHALRHRVQCAVWKSTSPLSPMPSRRPMRRRGWTTSSR
jgi:hypothetical protein